MIQNILENIGVKVTENEIQATQRLNKKGDVIMKFVSWKKAVESLAARKQLKDMDKNLFPPGMETITIYESLCNPFRYLIYKLRTAFKADSIHSCWVFNGVIRVKVSEASDPEVISHINDLVSLGLASDEDVTEFYSLH